MPITAIQEVIRPDYYRRISPVYRDMGLEDVDICEKALKQAKMLFEHTSGADPLYGNRRLQVELLENYLGFVRTNFAPADPEVDSWKNRPMTWQQKVIVTVGLFSLLFIFFQLIDGLMSSFMR